MKKLLQLFIALSLAACGQNKSSENSSIDSTNNQTTAPDGSLKDSTKKVLNIRDIDTGKTNPRKTGSISDASGSTGANNIKAEKDSLAKKAKEKK